MSNQVAKEGHVFVCQACGKMSRDRYGNQPISGGWDESCMLNCTEVAEDRLTIRHGRVVEVADPKEVVSP